jgi:hypothetical protein
MRRFKLSVLPSKISKSPTVFFLRHANRVNADTFVAVESRLALRAAPTFCKH